MQGSYSGVEQDLICCYTLVHSPEHPCLQPLPQHACPICFLHSFSSAAVECVVCIFYPWVMAFTAYLHCTISLVLAGQVMMLYASSDHWAVVDANNQLTCVLPKPQCSIIAILLSTTRIGTVQSTCSRPVVADWLAGQSRVTKQSGGSPRLWSLHPAMTCSHTWATSALVHLVP